MATTYSLISSSVLTGSQTAITFSAIPQTYTDLVIKFSARTASANPYSRIDMYLNTYDFASGFTQLQGSGSTAASSRDSGQGYTRATFGVNGNGATANTFSNCEIYIPSYTLATSKPHSFSTAQENNATAAYVQAVAGLDTTAEAITAIELRSANDFQAGSSFYLYGIKNS